MSKIEIEIVDSNPFNEGWLRYLLGMDRPKDDEDGPSVAGNGWDMGKETPQIRPIREVFIRQAVIDGQPQYLVRFLDADAEVLPVISTNPVVTNVGPDQQAEAKDIAKEHAAKVAGVDTAADVAEGEWAPAPRKKRV